MLGNFSYYNPTKLYFGDESLNFLKDELKGSLSGNTLSHSCVKSNSCSMLLLVVLCCLCSLPAFRSAALRLIILSYITIVKKIQ